ncbi:MAG: hypothetical protein PXY39_12825 [archaeon]|nr:hypothetical protein [archaeon]
MVDPFLVYGITTVFLMVPWPILWKKQELTTLRMIVLLFILDSVLTIEAALYSDIVLIAILHVVTVPALIGLIYLDLVQQHKSYFKCFICGKQIRADEEIETINRTLEGKPIHVIVHSECIRLERTDRKGISSRVFRKGIPK